MENNKFCPEGHAWIFVGHTTLYSDYYYCTECCKIYEPTVREVTEKEINSQFNSDRYTEMKDYARIKKAMKLVKSEDLRKLGYLE